MQNSLSSLSFNPFSVFSTQSDSYLATQSQIVEDKTIQKSLSSLNQLSESSRLLDEWEWEIIPDTKKLTEEILVNPLIIQSLTESVLNFDDWIIINNDESPISEDGWVLVDKEQLAYLKCDKEESWIKQWAITGGIPTTTMAMGTLQQVSGNQVGLSVLQGINLLKQIEIKNCAYVLPAAPIFIDLALKVYQDPSTDSFGVKVIKAAQSLDKKEVLFSLASCGIGLATAGMHGAMLKAGLIAFDLSGHVMTKIVSSAILAKGITNKTEKDTSSSLKKAAVYSYVASDALMLHKTALTFHTPEEIAAGMVWGLINLGVAQVLADRLVNSQNSPPQDSPLQKETTEQIDDNPIVNFFTEEKNLSSFINENYFKDKDEDK